MTTVSDTEAMADFSACLKASKTGPVVVTRRGKPVAVLLAAHNEDEVERLLMGHSAKLQAILETARQRFRAGGGIPHETFWKQVEAQTAADKARTEGRRNRTARHRSK